MNFEVLQSSAYKATKLVRETTSGRSFIKNHKKQRPQKGPLGYPSGDRTPVGAYPYPLEGLEGLEGLYFFTR